MIGAGAGDAVEAGGLTLVSEATKPIKDNYFAGPTYLDQIHVVTQLDPVVLQRNSLNVNFEVQDFVSLAHVVKTVPRDKVFKQRH